MSKECLKNSAEVFKDIISILTCIVVITLVVMLSILSVSGNLKIKVEKLSLGGINIIFENPDELFQKQMKNYLNTKRSLFYINPEKDNFSETLTSYYDTYKFTRDALEIYPTKYASKSELYKKSEEVLSNLNSFLTNNQNDYRRWYDYEIANNSKANYDVDIGDLQKQYRHYKELINAFEDLNQSFREYGDLIGVNYSKWNQ